MSIDVTVVVPVWNPGPYIEPLITSLLEQTLPADRLELLFVDDGATDETPARLDQLAVEHPHVRVLHQPNSGWPGKPRNDGTDAARGDYVFYVDQDDHLRPQSIERMLELGRPNDADIIIGKVVSDFRGVPHGVFRTNRARCTIHDAPLIDSLTPHKMFRRDFLREHGIRYPEGKRRLEDQLFMVRAYFAAKSVAIVGDYPCYFYKRRPDQNNAGSARIDPSGYYANLREVLDVVVANTEPGPFRDELLRRFYRVEVLGRLSEPAVLNYDDDYLRMLFDEVRQVAHDYFATSVGTGLLTWPRARARRLEAGDLDGVVTLAREAAPVTAECFLEDISREGAVWKLTLRAELVAGEAPLPLLLTASDTGWRVSVPGDAPAQVQASEADVASAFADVVIKERDTSVEWFVPHDMRAQLVPDAGGHRLTFTGTATLDAAALEGGRPLTRGSWDVAVRIHALGLVKRVRIGSARAHEPDEAASQPVAIDGGIVVMAYLTEGYGNVSLDVGERRKPLARELPRLAPLTVEETGSRVRLRVPVPLVGPADQAWTVSLARGLRTVAQVPAALTPAEADAAFLEVPAPRQRLRGRGFRWFAVNTHPDAAAVILGTWRMGPDGLTLAASAEDRDAAVEAWERAREAAKRSRRRRRRLRRIVTLDVRRR